MLEELDRWDKNYIDVEQIIRDFSDMKKELGALKDRVNRAEEARKVSESLSVVILTFYNKFNHYNIRFCLYEMDQ